MKLAAHNRNTEAGFLFPSGWRRDSARRLPLRKAAPSIRRDLPPQYTKEADCQNDGAQLAAVMRRIAWTR